MEPSMGQLYLATDMGRANMAYSFDGVDDYVRTHIFNSQEITFSSWVYVLEQIDDFIRSDVI